MGYCKLFGLMKFYTYYHPFATILNGNFNKTPTTLLNGNHILGKVGNYFLTLKQSTQPSQYKMMS